MINLDELKKSAEMKHLYVSVTPKDLSKLIDCAKALKEAQSLMGPKVPDCCGCVYEWTRALSVINKALDGIE